MRPELKFGDIMWRAVQKQPLGSYTKRELELILLGAAIESDLVKASPSQIAQTFRLGLTKAHGYLTDLALRSDSISDVEAVKRLALALHQAEVTPDRNHLFIPLNDAGLRIWLERKLAAQQLQQGESLRRELVKLTPAALVKVLDSASELKKPYMALNSLQKRYGKEVWFHEAKSHWKPDTPWADAFKNVGLDVFVSLVTNSVAAVTAG